MKLSVYDIIRVSNSKHDSGLTIWKFKISDVNIQELTEELLQPGIWSKFQPPHRYGTRKSAILNQFADNFNLFKDEIFDIVYKDDLMFSRMWYKGAAYYKQHTAMGSQILKDLPGQHMSAHLDNRHIMIQLILNLSDNTSGTGFYTSTSTAPVAIGPTELLHGAFFVNSSNAIHDITNITKDRYILYSVITIG